VAWRVDGRPPAPGTHAGADAARADGHARPDVDADIRSDGPATATPRPSPEPPSVPDPHTGTADVPAVGSVVSPTGTPAPRSRGGSAGARARGHRSAGRERRAAVHQRGRPEALTATGDDRARGGQRAIGSPPEHRRRPRHKLRAAIREITATIAHAVAPVATRAAFPAVLVALVLLFLGLQHRVDRRDPKLALAPVQRTPDLPFAPHPDQESAA
jgi:hypothetical protein